MTAGPIMPTGLPVLPEISTPAATAPPAAQTPPVQAASTPVSGVVSGVTGTAGTGPAGTGPAGTAAHEKTKATDKPAVSSASALAAEAGVPRLLRLRIEYNQAAGDFVYFGVDPKSGKVVNQYPTPEELERAAYWRKISGLVVDKNS